MVSWSPGAILAVVAMAAGRPLRPCGDDRDDRDDHPQGLVCLSHFGYIGHHLIVAIWLTIYHSWLGDVKNGDI